MTTIGMHYDVIPGKEEEFEQGFLATLEHLKAVPGHVESHLYEDVASRGSYLIQSQWRSKEDFQAAAPSRIVSRDGRSLRCGRKFLTTRG